MPVSMPISSHMKHEILGADIAGGALVRGERAAAEPGDGGIEDGDAHLEAGIRVGDAHAARVVQMQRQRSSGKRSRTAPTMRLIDFGVAQAIVSASENTCELDTVLGRDVEQLLHQVEHALSGISPSKLQPNAAMMRRASAGCRAACSVRMVSCACGCCPPSCGSGCVPGTSAMRSARTSPRCPAARWRIARSQTLSGSARARCSARPVCDCSRCTTSSASAMPGTRFGLTNDTTWMWLSPVSDSASISSSLRSVGIGPFSNLEALARAFLVDLHEFREVGHAGSPWDFARLNTCPLRMPRARDFHQPRYAVACPACGQGRIR